MIYAALKIERWEREGRAGPQGRTDRQTGPGNRNGKGREGWSGRGVEEDG